jgi:2-polyprenyl-3-methyl-5-hydroxy-6-metoxy-1,4-benzoquinol methylase
MSTYPQQAYADKPAEYFVGARQDIVDLMVANSMADILEIGCGSGATALIAKEQGKAGRYVGVEISPTAAVRARAVLDLVVEDDVEGLDFTTLGHEFDCVIMSEVLEHLLDPWNVVARVAAVSKPGAQIFASSPNIASRRVVISLLRGDFQYSDAGVMDRTHVRWFTPGTFRAMFEAAGYRTISVSPVSSPSAKVMLFNWLTGGRLQHLFTTQILYVGYKA